MAAQSVHDFEIYKHVWCFVIDKQTPVLKDEES